MDESSGEWVECMMSVEMREDLVVLSVSFLLSMGVYMFVVERGGDEVESVCEVCCEERWDDGDSENIEWMSSEEGRRMIWLK